MTSTHHEKSAPLGGQNAPAKKLKPRCEAAPANASPPREQKHWLVKYAVTDIGLLCDQRTLTEPGIVEAPDIKAAEDEALRTHAQEGYSEEEPFAAVDSELGKWINFGGFRAFEIGENHCDVDAGNVLWVEFIQEVSGEDAAILKKHLNYGHTKAEEDEQYKLRGIKAEAE